MFSIKPNEPSCALFQCYSDEYSCFLLDNNAYILVSKDESHVGRFIGSVRPKTMHLLVVDDIYHKTRIFDYQSICYKDPPQPKSRSPAYRNSSVSKASLPLVVSQNNLQ